MTSVRYRFLIRLRDYKTEIDVIEVLVAALRPEAIELARFEDLDSNIAELDDDHSNDTETSQLIFVLDDAVELQSLIRSKPMILLDTRLLNNTTEYEGISDVTTFQTSSPLDYVIELMERFSGPAAPAQLFDAALVARMRVISADHPYPPRPAWRTEPEIPPNRQTELCACLETTPDAVKGRYPFSGMSLTRSDVEWLLSQSRLPVPGTETFPSRPDYATIYRPGSSMALWVLSGLAGLRADKAEGYSWFGFVRRRRDALDLRGADLSGQNLSNLPLEFVKAGVWEIDFGQSYSWTDELIAAAAANLEGASLENASCIGAVLVGARMKGVYANSCDFTDADMRYVHLQGAHLDNATLVRANLGGADARRASLESTALALASLGGADLSDAILANATAEGTDFIHLRSGGRADSLAADLTRADISKARAEGAIFGDVFASANLTDSLVASTVFAGAEMTGVHLVRVDLTTCCLVGANLRRAQLGEATFGREDQGAALDSGTLPDDPQSIETMRARFAAIEQGEPERSRELLKRPSALSRVQRWLHDFPETLPPTDLRGAYLDSLTRLHSPTFVRAAASGVRVEGVHWGGADLSKVAWADIPAIGDEVVVNARDSESSSDSELAETEAAVRANRQLATALREQGLTDEGDQFALRAKIMQRRTFLLKHDWARYSGSLILSILAGYGYRPSRALVAYIGVLITFAVLLSIATCGGAHPLTVREAIVASIYAFHGRGYFSGSPGALSGTANLISAIEGLLGLVVEVTLIATFTQRFLSR